MRHKFLFWSAILLILNIRSYSRNLGSRDIDTGLHHIPIMNTCRYQSTPRKAYKTGTSHDQMWSHQLIPLVLILSLTGRREERRGGSRRWRMTIFSCCCCRRCRSLNGFAEVSVHRMNHHHPPHHHKNTTSHHLQEYFSHCFVVINFTSDAVVVLVMKKTSTSWITIKSHPV